MQVESNNSDDSNNNNNSQHTATRHVRRNEMKTMLQRCKYLPDWAKKTIQGLYDGPNSVGYGCLLLLGLRSPWSRIDDDMIMELTPCLGILGDKVKDLNLGWNKITSKGANRLFQHLKNNDSKIAKLDLFSNPLSNSCIMSLGEFLKTNKYIEHINIGTNKTIGEDNKINDDGMRILSNYLIGNTTFKSLELHGDMNISDSAYPYFELMAKKSAIVHINLQETKVSNENQELLKTLLAIPVEDREIEIDKIPGETRVTENKNNSNSSSNFVDIPDTQEEPIQSDLKQGFSENHLSDEFLSMNGKLEKVLTHEFRDGIDIRALYQHFLGDSEQALMFLPDFHRENGDTDVSMSKWELISEEESNCYPDFSLFGNRVHFRKVEYKAHPNRWLLPESISVKKKQHYCYFKNENVLICQNILINDAPYGDCFTINERWVFRQTENEPRCSLTVFFSPIFVKQTTFESSIRKGIKDESITIIENLQAKILSTFGSRALPPASKLEAAAEPHPSPHAAHAPQPQKPPTKFFSMSTVHENPLQVSLLGVGLSIIALQLYIIFYRDCGYVRG